MFTGIITAVGNIVAVQRLGGDAAFGNVLQVQAPPGYLDDVELGDSIAMNGACMTVARMDAAAQRFDVEVSAESLQRTTGLQEKGEVNLEKALTAHQRLGGHIVSGHVDAVGTVERFAQVGESWELRVRAPAPLRPFIAYKGSIAVQGVSLTVNEVVDDADGCVFSINLVPHTVAHTTLKHLHTGAPLNLEIDTVARYVVRALQAGGVA